jgi:hypothetical protein
MKAWTAEVMVGKAAVTLSGTGAVNVGDLIGEALSTPVTTLEGVMVEVQTEGDHLPIGLGVGFRVGTTHMWATISILDVT